MPDIYLNNPELKAAVARSGSTGAAAEDDFLARARAFNGREGLEDYSRGASNQFFRRLNDLLADNRANAVGRGALNTGFFTEGQDRVVRDAANDFTDQLQQRALQAQGLDLQNQSQLGSFGQAKSTDYLDALSGLTTSKYQQDATTAASKRAGKSNLIGAGITAAGTILGGPVGTVVAEGAKKLLGKIFSDEEAKEGIEGIRSALDKLKELEGYLFQYTDEAQGMGAPPGQQAGVMAQDVEQVMPEAVGEQGGMKTVDYTAITGLLTEAVKELEGRLAALEGKMGGEEEQLEGPPEAAAALAPQMAAGQPPMDPSMIMSDKRAKTKVRKIAGRK